ncbi:hypothetical protein [Chitinophaga qingshengii]|uniref:Uncharacterized protein n=1 Tax=Chitinophaga qingshengii TaxID=1569794 RepID=A0ABR7TPV6_9BACT|nr:hypothetical protein [Chitinophaga qingshengii]MBC9932025.1 hypothetical protein [Chitinophaga qingshengii]
MSINAIELLAESRISAHRSYLKTLTPDIWSPKECLLVEDSEPSIHGLISLCEGRSNNPSPGSEPYTQVIAEPGYVPYTSGKVSTTTVGDEMCRLAVEAVFSKDLQQLLSAGPLATAAILAAATVAVGKTKAGKWIPEVGVLIPKKGNEVLALWQEYRKWASGKMEHAAPMMIRDFFGSALAWQFIRINDGRIHDLGGAIMCITTGSDFVGSADDPGLGDMEIYLSAMNEGLACLGGSAVTPAIRDAVLCAAFMQTRKAVTAVTMKRDIEELKRLLANNNGPVTPGEFMTMRWWEAAMVGYHRIGLGADGYRHLADDTGVFTATRKCGKIRRAVDNLIRYDEAVDIIFDATQGDGLNEALVAMSAAGSKGIAGYAHALAAVTDEVFHCDCGEEGHIDVGEMSMASCLWYAIIPRYLIRAQLDGLEKGSPAIQNAFAPAKPGERNVIAQTLPGEQLHTDSWDPLWTVTGTDISGLVSRTLKRVLLEDVYSEEIYHRCNDIATDVLTDCMSMEYDKPQLLPLSEKWCRLFDEALINFREDFSGPIAALRELVGRIWIHLIIGDNGENGDTHARIFVDMDRHFRSTYSLPALAGRAIRRAYLGTVSSSMEFSGFNPYHCLVEGVTRIC